MDKLEALMKCSLCFELFKTPRQLSCQHTFCENCLSTYIRQHSSQVSNIDATVKCPVCFVDVVVNNTPNGSSEFPLNLTMVSFLNCRKLIVSNVAGSADADTEGRTDGPLQQKSDKDTTLPGGLMYREWNGESALDIFAKYIINPFGLLRGRQLLSVFVFLGYLILGIYNYYQLNVLFMKLNERYAERWYTFIVTSVLANQLFLKNTFKGGKSCKEIYQTIFINIIMNIVILFWLKLIIKCFAYGCVCLEENRQECHQGYDLGRFTDSELE